MHDNEKNSGLVHSGALAALGSILIVLKKSIAMKDRSWRSPANLRATDYMSEVWENVDLMRRRMTI